MTDMLRIAEEAAEQAKFSLVSIDLNTIVFTLINTLIIVLLYFFFLHKPVCKILDERAKTVNKDMDDAQKAKEEAAAVKADYEHRLETSKEEAARIVADAKKAQAREDEIISAANEEAASMKQRAEESIEREKKRAVNEIKEEISDMVVMAASKVAEKEINAQDNEKIIDSVLSQIGKEN